MSSCKSLLLSSWFGEVGPDLPVVVGAEHLAGDLSAGYALDGVAHGGVQHVANAGGLAHVALGGATSHGKWFALNLRQRVEVFDKFFHEQILPQGKSIVNTSRLFT